MEVSKTLIPCLLTEFITICTSKGVRYEEFTVIELTSKPFRKVKAEEKEELWEAKGMNAEICLPEQQEESDAVSI